MLGAPRIQGRCRLAIFLRPFRAWNEFAPAARKERKVEGRKVGEAAGLRVVNDPSGHNRPAGGVVAFDEGQQSLKGFAALPSKNDHL